MFVTTIIGWIMTVGMSCASPPTKPEPVAAEVAVSDPEPNPRPWNACPVAVTDLPAHPLFNPDDPRLRGEALIVVLKTRRRIGLYARGRLATVDGREGCWPMALAWGYPAGTKTQQGDRKTPEGWYRTSDKPTSNYYGAIAIHYPNSFDAEAGLVAGTLTEGQRDAIVSALERDQKPEQYTGMGGEILIHGGGAGLDWTLGCVAMDNPSLDGLRARLPKGLRTDVLILP